MLGKLRGEITIFLTLVLVLILALVGTMIEGVRINVAKVVSERTLITAMDSAASQYSIPLFQDYHLVLLDLGYDSNQINENNAISDMLESIEYSFNPEKDLSLLGTSVPISNINLLKLYMDDLKITEMTRITDYNGNLFINQAVQYEKYKDLSNIVQRFLNKLKLLQSTQSASVVIKEKLKMDEKLMELDKYNMELMELIEGINFNKEGLQLISSNEIKTNNEFVKMIVYGSPSAQKLGINHKVIYQSLEGKYIDVQDLLQQILTSLSRTTQILNEIKVLEKELDELNSIKENDNKAKKGNQDKKAQKKLKEQIDTITEELNDLQNEKDQLIESINQYSSKVNEVKNNALTKVKRSIEVINERDSKKPDIKNSIDEYKKILESNKGNLDQEFYQSLIDEINESESNLLSENERIGNQGQSSMKQLLMDNKSILDINHLKTLSNSSSLVDIEELIKIINNFKSNFQSYHTGDLSFDYSHVVLNSKVENPITNLISLVSNGVLDLIVDDVNSLSDASLKGDSLYLKYTEEESKRDSNQNKMSEQLEDSYENKTSKEVGSSFDEYNQESGTLENLGNTTSNILDKLLFNEYILRHFKSMKFTKEETQSGEVNNKSDNTKDILNNNIANENITNNSTANKFKSGSNNQNNITNIESETVKSLDSVLEYEQEYIITGNKSDKDNFNSIVLRLMSIRTILNFIYLISDKTKVQLADKTALAIVGFTGFAALVQFTKMLILLTWSYEESLIDVRALLYDKSVPLLKNKDTFLLEYSEILGVNKALIKNKVDHIKDDRNIELDFNYDDYISLFLLLTSDSKKSYRAMDLIQANMNLRYQGGFLMENCLYGFQVKARVGMNSLFIKLPFVNRLIDHDINKYIFEWDREYAY